MKQLVEKILQTLENSQLTLPSLFFALLGITITRLSVEFGLDSFRSVSGTFAFYEFAHTFLFFTLAFLVLVGVIARMLKEKLKTVASVFIFGYLIIITPPVFDYIISRGNVFWSFYKFDSLAGLGWRFLTFFGDRPDIGITYGTRIEVALSLVFIFLYSFVKLLRRQSSEIKNSNSTDNFLALLKSLDIAFLTYIIFFILGTFPSWITIIVAGLSKGFLSVNDIDIAQMFLTPSAIFSRFNPDMASALNIKMSIVYSLAITTFMLGGFYTLQKKKLLAFVKNARFPQLIYHAGLFSIGLGLSKIFTAAVWELNFFNFLSFGLAIEAVFLAWLASVVINDLADKKIDRETNSDRPLIQNIFSEPEYVLLGIALFLFSVFFGAVVSFKLALFLLVYQAIAWIYSAWPLRLKRFPLVATFLSAAASLLILSAGFSLGSASESVRELPLAIVALLVIGYTLSLPIKDFKDIEGDRQDGIYTIPVLFGEPWGKILVGSGIFVSFLLSIVFLKEPRLFWWAVIFGGLSFWLVNKTQPLAESRRLNYRNIFWWLLAAVSTYGLILVKIIFLK